MVNSSCQLKLRILWHKDTLGLAIDQTFLNKVCPLTQYYFWPRTEAWELLKLDLDAKPWLTETEKVIILNLSTDIITQWRINRSNVDIESIKNTFSNATIVEFST